MLKPHARHLDLVLALLAVTACGNGSDSDGASGASAASSGATGPGATEVVVEGNAATPSDGDTSSEAPNAGLGDAPLDGAAAGEASSPPASAGEGAESEMSPMEGASSEAPGPATFPSDVARPKIMIVGDSISAGPGCYKKYLLAELNENGFTNFDFVGEYTDDCGGGVMHSARSCTTVFDYTQPEFTLRADCGGGTFPGLQALMAEHRPDLLMIQLGVNDTWNGLATDAILANYSTLLQQARAENPSIVVALAQIHQIRPSGDPNGDAVFARAQALVEAVPEWARAESQPTSPVFVADLWTNSDPAESGDGVHPDEAGAQRMGSNWFEALRVILPAD